MSQIFDMQINIPQFSEDRIKEIVKLKYGIDGDAKSLSSYTDQNFLIQESKGDQYIFKILNQKEDPSLIEGQQSTLEHLNENTPYTFQSIIPSARGRNIEQIEDQQDRSYYCWMVSYLPGKFLGELPEHSDQLYNSLGRFLGYMDQALELFDHAAFKRYLRWDLDNTPDIRILIQHIDDAKKRNLVCHFLNQHETYVIPKLPELKKGIIHNDANDFNILVDTVEDIVTGIIDFGDMVYTHIINELAIALAYTMMHKDDPVQAVLSIVGSYHKIFPLHEKELEILYYLIASRLCISVSISALDFKQNPDNEYIRISEKPAWDLLYKLTEIDPFRAWNMFRNACEFDSFNPPGKSKSEIIKTREKHIGKALSVSYKNPLKIVRGLYQYLFDEEGRSYLDTVNNVSHVGHCHPKVVEAAQTQITILNTNTRYLHDNIIEYAEKLTSTLPDPLNVCFFTCSGSEANELALRMAKNHTGISDIIVIDNAYHGNTNALIDISPYKFDGPGGKGCPDHTHKVMMPDLFRGPYKMNDPGAGQKYATDVDRVIEEIHKEEKQVSAFIFESIAGVGGQVVWPENYLKEAFQYVRTAGGVCIADEVQVGFGRIGSHMWGFETQQVIPDIVTLGKPIGNGHPLAAVITTTEIAETFNNGMEYFNTFGGNPVSCAIGMAVMNVLEEEKLQEHALRTGNYLKSGLNELKERFDIIGDVRGMGLFLGIEFILNKETLDPAEDQTELICERMKEEGILTSIDGPLHNVIKIKPPLPFNEKNADQYISALHKILKEIT